MSTDICPSRDDAQPHLWEGDHCSLCAAPKPHMSWEWTCGMFHCRLKDQAQTPMDPAVPDGLPRCMACGASVIQRRKTTTPAP